MSPCTTLENPEENARFGEGAAPGAAVGAQSAPIDAKLRAIIEAWHDLPDAVKADILAMIHAAAGAD